MLSNFLLFKKIKTVQQFLKRKKQVSITSSKTVGKGDKKAIFKKLSLFFCLTFKQGCISFLDIQTTLTSLVLTGKISI